MDRPRFYHREPPYRIGPPSPLAVRVFGGPVHALVRVLGRATLEGAEHLPDGPFVLVANHPPCLGLAELSAFMALWARRFGARPLAGFAHVAAHLVPPLRWVFHQIGAIPSTYAAAERALAAGVPIVVFPGGDHEAFRPFWERGADLAGREGFLRIARRAGVPLVPMGIRGASAPVLVRARVLATLAVWPRLLGVKRFGLTVLGALGAAAIVALAPVALPWRLVLAWLWCVSPFALLSWVPTRTRIRIGPPLAPTVGGANVEAAITALLG